MKALLNSTKRAAIFIDGNNLSLIQTDFLYWTVDLLKLVSWIERSYDCRLMVRIYYIGNVHTYPAQKKFFRAIACNGFEVRPKEARIVNGKPRPNFKVEIATDMQIRKDQYDLAVLVSGEGDFAYALRNLTTLGKEVLLLATRDCIGLDLRMAVGRNYKDFLDIRSEIELIDKEHVPEDQSKHQSDENPGEKEGDTKISILSDNAILKKLFPFEVDKCSQ